MTGYHAVNCGSYSVNMCFSQISGHTVGVSLRVCLLFYLCDVCVAGDTHLVRLGACQTARQRAAVAGQSGGEGRAAVCQDRFKVTGQLLRRVTTTVT